MAEIADLEGALPWKEKARKWEDRKKERKNERTNEKRLIGRGEVIWENRNYLEMTIKNGENED